MRKSLPSALLVLLGVSIFCPSSALPDQVFFANGDRLTGRVIRVEEGTLFLETEFSEAIEIDTALVAGLVADEPLEVHLTSGSILHGTIAGGGSGRLLVQPTGGGEKVPVTWEQISSINPPPRRWSASLSVGASAQSGNTQRGSASIEGDTTWKGGRNRLGLHFLFNYAEEDGRLTARNTFGGLSWDYFLHPPLYSHLGGELLADEFRDLDLRAVIGPALGYQVWDEERRSLAFELGASYFIERRQGSDDERRATARASGALSYEPLDGLTLANHLVVYPSLESLSQYQLRNDASVSSAIHGAWSVKLSNIVEFDSQPPPGVKETDLSWILGLRYSF